MCCDYGTLIAISLATEKEKLSRNVAYLLTIIPLFIDG